MDEDLLRRDPDSKRDGGMVEVPLTSVPQEMISRALASLRAGHHLAGTALDGDPPLLVFRIPEGASIQELRKKGNYIYPYGRSPQFGACFTFTTPFEVRGELDSMHRTFVFKNTPVFPKLENGKFRALFVFKQHPVMAMTSRRRPGSASHIFLFRVWLRSKPSESPKPAW